MTSPAEALADKIKNTVKVTKPRRPRVSHFACDIIARRTALGLSQRHVQLASGVSSLQEIERGKNCNLDAAMKLARFFGVAVEEIWQLLPEDEAKK